MDNSNCGQHLNQCRTDREDAINTLKLVYRKHVCNDDSIGWDELSDKLCDCICRIAGEVEFNTWVEQLTEATIKE